MTQRWTFEDVAADETWVMPINPNTASSPFAARNISTVAGSDPSAGLGRTRMFEQPPTLASWQFGGLLRSKAHHDELLRWVKKDREVLVTDHLGRTFAVLFQGVSTTDQRPRGGNDWRMTYDVTALVLRRVT